jgi:nucleotide-binding universal stress UspA family protein
MQVFTNILVGVDPARYNPLDPSGGSASVAGPIQWGLRLAKANSARLTFFSAGNVREDALALLAPEDRASVLDRLSQGSGKVLHRLVEQARKDGVQAQGTFVPGTGWLEIIRQVLHNRHDLVVVGTRDLSKLGHLLFGNTAMKLLRRCPCPVLVTRAAGGPNGIEGAPPAPFNILVGTSLRPPSQQILQLGSALAGQLNANLHVLHVVEYELHEICNIGLPDARQEDYRRKVRTRAQEALQAQLQAVDFTDLGSRLHVHLAADVDLPDVAIQRFIEAHHIDLLVMGTIARGGIRGIMIGDTAERLLYKVGCAVLAVKPDDFVCPIEA